MFILTLENIRYKKYSPAAYNTTIQIHTSKEAFLGTISIFAKTLSTQFDTYLFVGWVGGDDCSELVDGIGFVEVEVIPQSTKDSSC